MILEIRVIGTNPDGAMRIKATDGHGFTYVGGINQDMVDALAGRKLAWFEANLGPSGIEVGAEVRVELKTDYRPCACGMDCPKLDENPAEPCWGDVTVIDVEYTDDGDRRDFHACRGHANQLDPCVLGPYEPPPKQVDPPPPTA